jgi:hypothetical protein
MSPLESWVVVLSLVGGIAWTTFQAYRLAKWKEEMGEG